MAVVYFLTLISLNVSFVRLGFPGLLTFLPQIQELVAGCLRHLLLTCLLLLALTLFETVQKKKTHCW